MYQQHPSSFFNKAKQTQNESRIISCIDMDAFYAKAEALRNGLDENLPIVVIHGRSSISINYAARKYGITRYGPTLLTEVDEMRRLCPHVILIHVDTIKPGEPYIDPYKRDLKDKFIIRNRDDEKVNLDFYRMEAEKIRTIFAKYCCCVEKASIDESFLDLTQEVNQIYLKREYDPQLWKAKLAGGEEFTPETMQDILLMIASQLTDKIRKEVEATLKYTCSAGISYNKMLAKVASTLNKPNDQTVILERFTQEALNPLEISRLRNFGGKIAEVFKTANYKTLGDIQRLSLEELQQILGDVNSAKWVYFRCRGFDDEAVGKKDIISNKSLSSNKSFAIKITSMIELENMIDLILLDLATRTARFFKENGALPTNLNLHYWDNLKREQKTKSTSINLNNNYDDVKDEKLLETMKLKAQDLLKISHSILFPCKTIGVSVRHFVKKDVGNSNLLSFLKKNSKIKNNKIINSFAIEEEEKSDIFEVDFNHDKDENEQQQSMIVENKKQTFCEKVKCEKCQILIPSDELMSHQDLHLAFDLDKELNPNKKKYRKLNESEVEITLNQMDNISPQNSSVSGQVKNQLIETKKKQNKSKGEPIKMKSLESFFQKK